MTQTRQKPKGGRGKGGYDFIRNGIDDYPLPTRLVYNFVAAVLWLFSSIMWPTRFEGLDELVDHVRERGTVIVMNHTSMVEPVVFIVGLWRRHVRVRPIYKAEFEKIGPAKWLFRRMGGIPVDRGSADLKALKAARDALGRGECVLIYPEGTRIKNDEQPIEVHGGFAMIAQMGKSDVTPTAVVGAADPYKTRPTRRRKPRIRCGRPISFTELDGTSRKEKLAEMERVAMERVYALRDELRHDYPGLW
ncbi:lysophospholipid acyltransferase family protein [Parolsenella catena]|uniref:lysophospholipid acyltransferase family protein n=1 Tax=Parolsenella catena TaxID=2003188 RepID=UPI003A935AED